jgi:sulfane dehydrogenase subunit SoxC
MPFDVTPAGPAYLLTHDDIPLIDPQVFRVVVDGLAETPLSLDLHALRQRPG